MSTRASKPTVTLVFAGDGESLAQTTDQVKREVAEVGQAADATASPFARMRERVTGAFGSILSTATSAVKGPAGLVALVPIAATVGAAAGGAMVLGFGAGLAGLGLMVAAKRPEVKAAFAGLKEEVSQEMTRISAPFSQTLIDISAQLRGTFREFVPELERANQEIAPKVSEFTGHLFDAFGELDVVIEPMVDAFGELLDEIGPELPGHFARIADSLVMLADAVAENPEPLADMIGLALILVSVAITLIGWIVQVQGAFTHLREAIVGLARDGFRVLVDAFLGSAEIIITGAANAFGWIPGIGDKLRGAAAEFSAFRESVNRHLAGIRDRTVNVNFVGSASGVATRIALPAMQRFHGGGTVDGEPGTDVVTLLRAGEHVSASGNRGRGTVVRFAGDLDGALATAIMHLIRTGQIELDTASAA